MTDDSKHEEALDVHIHTSNTAETNTFLNNEDLDHKTTAISTADPFIWLSGWIAYCPLVSKSKLSNGKVIQCNSVFPIVYLVVAIAITIGECLWYSVPLFIEYGFTLFSVVYSVAMLLVSISKFISLYYFWTHFKFHTLRTVSLADETVDIECNKIIHKVNTRMKVILGIVMGCIVALIIIKIAKIVTNEESVWMDWLYLLRSVLYYWMFDIPLFLTQFILSIYYCKGHIFICNLDHMVRDDINEVDFGCIWSRYKAFRSQFRQSIAVLEFLLKCRLTALIAWIWIDITSLAEAETVLSGMQSCVYLAFTSLPFIELVFSGSPATTKYHSFKKKVYAIKKVSLKLIYLLQYMVNYPFLVKIFAKEISFKNAMRMTGAFLVAKILSYLFKVKVN